MSDTAGRLPSSQGFDHLIYLRVFEGCNLHCKHCFIPSNPKRMTQDHLAKVPDQIEGKIPHGSRILVQWHGGEPTLMGAEYIRSGIEYLREHAPQYDWRHGIQTNLMSFDETWAALYHEEFGGEVGISWDPKIRLLNARAEDSHPEFNRRFEEKLSNLVSAGLTPYVVVTAAKTLFETFPNPFEFFQHWIDRGVKHVHLERITETGYARTNWQSVGLSNAEYSHTMSKWMKAYATFLKASGPDAPFILSPFENLLDSASSLNAGTARKHGCWSGACDTRYHTIDSQGYKFGCTALTSEQGNRGTNHNLDLGPDLKTKRELRTFDCHSCKFRPICSSGCLALSFDDGSGECSGGSKLFQTATELAQSEKYRKAGIQ